MATKKKAPTNAPSANEDVVVTRRIYEKAPQLSILKDLYVEWGSKADWDALCELHYKGHTLAAGSRFVRCMLREDGQEPRLVGIMVFGNPQPLSKGRNMVFPYMSPNKQGMDNRMVNQIRMNWINKNITWNNRTVLDTMYRSAGIAYRFKNLAYRLYCSRYGYRYVESVSSMGRFNPFSVKTGMKFVKPKAATALEPGLKFFAAHFKSDPSDIAAIMREFREIPDSERPFFDRRLREFYFRWSAMEKSGDKRSLGMSRIDTLPIEHIIKEIMQLVFSATVYWIWEAVDEKGTVPEMLPILAFDEQGPNEPLKHLWTKENA